MWTQLNVCRINKHLKIVVKVAMKSFFLPHLEKCFEGDHAHGITNFMAEELPSAVDRYT